MYPQAIRRLHYDIITWKCISYYWNIVPGFHRSTTCTKKLPQLTKRLTGLSPFPRRNHLDANTFQLCGKTVRYIPFKFHIIKICAQNFCLLHCWWSFSNSDRSGEISSSPAISTEYSSNLYKTWCLFFPWECFSSGLISYESFVCWLFIYQNCPGVQHDIGRIQVSLGPITMRLKRSASI